MQKKINSLIFQLKDRYLMTGIGLLFIMHCLCIAGDLFFLQQVFQVLAELGPQIGTAEGKLYGGF